MLGSLILEAAEAGVELSWELLGTEAGETVDTKHDWDVVGWWEGAPSVHAAVMTGTLDCGGISWVPALAHAWGLASNVKGPLGSAAEDGVESTTGQSPVSKLTEARDVADAGVEAAKLALVVVGTLAHLVWCC
eukprot:m.351462 g.351462  ORF g.351462 m.351462 type:complete len:133 (-) comp16251_c0_seq1:113-511(-)